MKKVSVTSFLFGLFAFVLLVNVSYFNVPDYKIWASSLDLTFLELSAQKDSSLSQFARLRKYRETLPCYQKVLKYDALNVQLNNFLDSTIKIINQRQSNSLLYNKKLAKQLFIEQHFGDSIYRKLKDFQEELLNGLNELHYGDIKGFKSRYANVGIDDFSASGWSKRMFDNITLNAAVDIIKAFKNNAVLLELHVIYHFRSWCTPIIENFSTIRCASFTDTPCSYLPGQKCRAIIMLLDFYHDPNPKITATSGHVFAIKDEDRFWGWWDRPKTLGLHTVTGTFTVASDTGYATRFWAFQYFVYAKGCALKLDNSYVCYAGIPNPVTASVPGYSDDKLSLKVPGATVSKMANGHFEILIKHYTNRSLKAYLYAENSAHHTSLIEIDDLIVKYAPTPIATIAGLNASVIKREKLLDQQKISLIPSDGDFPMPYKISSYSFLIIKGTTHTSTLPIMIEGEKFIEQPDIKREISLALPGDKLIISDILATDNYGNKISLTPIIIKID